MRRHRESSRGRSAALRDLLLILAAVFALVVLGSASGLFALGYEWVDQRFEAHLGNAIAALVLLCVGLAAFGSMQSRSARRESAARRGVEDRFRTLVERVPAVTYLWDSASRSGEAPAQYISPQVEALLGYAPEEFEDPMLWLNRIHPDDLERVKDEWRACEHGETPFRSEYRMRARDGRTVWVRDEAAPVVRNGGRALFQGVIFDITERKLAEDRLLEAEERFRSLVEQVPAITYIEEPDGGYRYISPQIEAMLGYSVQEWMAHPSLWEQSLHADDRERVLAEGRADAGDVWSSSHRMITRDGRVVWVQNHALLLRDPDGKPRYWQGVVFDITELKTAEDRITEAETSYRTLVEQLPVVVYRDAIDDVSTALYISPQYEQLFGFPAEARLRDPEFWIDHLHPDDRDRIVELSRWTNETGEPFSAEYRFLASEGRVVWVRDEAVLLRDPDGKPLLWQGVLLDVTARKHAEEALSRRDAVLEAIGFAAERFLKSHEWSSALHDVLERIGTAAAASRVYVYENETLQDGRLAMSLRSEWLAPGIASNDTPTNQGFPYADGFIRWQAVLSGGMELHGLTRNFPEAERAAMQAEAVLSQIVVPVFVGDDWWGFLGLDDCVAERVWALAEVEALKAAADTLGAAIGRTLAEQERVAAQITAAELEARTSAVLASALEGIVTMGPEGKIVDFNPAAERMFGRRREDVVGQLLADVMIPSEFRERHRAALARYLETGEPTILGKRLELEAVRASDERFPVELTVTEVQMPGATLFTGFIRDLTERKQAEQQLRETEERYRALVEAAPAVVYRMGMDEAWPLLFVSPSVQDVFGNPPEWWNDPPRSWRGFIHPDDLAAVDRNTVRAVESGEAFGMEYRVIRPDGRMMWIFDNAVLVSDESGEPRYWQGIFVDLSTQKELEEAQKESELRYRSVVENVPMITYLEGPGGQGDLRFISPQVEAILGYTPEERYADPSAWLKLVHPDDLDALVVEEDGTQVTGEPFHAEYRVRAKDGRWVWILDEAVPILDEHGTRLFWQGMQRDVTERHEAEQALRESEERRETALAGAPLILYAYDGEGRILFAEGQGLASLGLRPEEIVGLTVYQVYPDEPAVLDILERSIAGQDVNESIRIGDVVLDVQSRAELDEDGRVARVIGVATDVTARSNAEEALRREEARYRAIVEHIPAAVYIDIPDGSMETLYVSPQIEQIMGCTPEQYLADPDLWLDRMPDEGQRSEMRESYLAAIEQRRPWTGEYLIRHPDGREVWVHDETTFAFGADGEPLFLQGVMYDVTERKLIHQALEDSERREREAAEGLRSLDEMKNTFLAAVSHELRSPLTSILGLTLTLERHRFPEEEEADLLGRLATNARKLDRLLKDLLDIDRLSRGIVTPKVRPTDLASIVERTVESLDVLAERSILVQAEPVVISVDPPKIERIVENLVMNAARHTGPDVGIWVRVWSQDGGAVIAVEDDGPGVPSDLRHVIFEPFRQGPTSASSPSPGTGIGLSLVAMFAELHGGRAWVEDREGGGASFRVFLPGSPTDRATGNGRDVGDQRTVGSRTSG